jgi:superfamily II DNA helicase RecQ
MSNLLQNKSVCAILPTGFGKSLFFTLPPLMLDVSAKKTNISIVISPLKALMREQVQLQKMEISAASIGVRKEMENETVKGICILYLFCLASFTHARTFTHTPTRTHCI